MLKLLILVLSGTMLIYTYRKRRLLSSVSVWVLCYILIFVIYPLFGLGTRVINESLIDIMAVIGIIAFIIGILFGERIRLTTRDAFPDSQPIFPDFKLAVILFWAFFAVTLFILFSKLGLTGIRSILQGQLTA